MICEIHNEILVQYEGIDWICFSCFKNLPVKSEYVQVDKKELLKVCEIFTKNLNYANCHYGDANLLMNFVEKYLGEKGG